MTMSDKIKILYIDDEEINVQLFQIIFSKNYEVLTGYSGFEGIEILAEHIDTAVVISDLKMPVMNGLEFIKKAKEKYPNKKYYILSGFEITAEIKEALDSGLIHKYFGKPFNLQEIERAINKQ